MRDQILNQVLLIITFVLVGIGLLSMSLGWLVKQWDRAGCWWAGQAEIAERRREAPRVRAPLVKIHVGPNALAGDDEPAERPNDRAPRSNAIEPRSVGSVRSIEPPDRPVIDGPTLALMQRIAAHKVKHPGDGKEVSALAVSGAKKGSSKAYQTFSQAWDLLYPPLQPDVPPVESPEAWEAGPRPGQLVRR